MRAVALGVIGFAVGIFADAVESRAADWPAVVIPGKRGVPVIMNGVDVSYAIVEGDYGLDRPQQVPLTIIPRWPYTPPAGIYYSAIPGNPRPYYPGDGRRHGYGDL